MNLQQDNSKYLEMDHKSERFRLIFHSFTK